MQKLLIWKARNEVDAHVPEFDYLLQQLLVEARSVYDQADLIVSDSDSSSEIEAAGPKGPNGPNGPNGLESSEGSEASDLLLIGEANVLLRRSSLRRMNEEILAGADVVFPQPITDFHQALADQPIYTQRGFEGLEARLLDRASSQTDTEAAPVPPHLPVCLLRGECFERARSGEKMTTAWRRPEALARELISRKDISEQRLRRAGVYHEFIDYYGETRADILPYIPDSTQTAQEVLEVGCGRGGTAELLTRERGCRVTGVELNPVVARIARERMYAVLSGDIEELQIEGAFDVFLALEVIEHLSDPEAFLRKARDLTKPGGRIVLSTPNVGHYPVVEDLLAGRWDYSATGVLCATHIRFFTRRTLEDLLDRCGFDSFAVHGQHTELPERVSKLAESMEVDQESLKTRDLIAVIEP